MISEMETRALIAEKPELFEEVACDLCGAWDWRQVRVLGGYPIVRCRRCGFCFANPQLKPEVLAAGYNNDTEVAKEVHSTEDLLAHYREMEPAHRHNFGRILDTLDRLCRVGKVLDVGCGPGIFLEMARDRGWEVAGVEIGSWAREAARERDLPVHIGTLEDAPFQEGEFDLITFHATVEHLSSPREVLSEAGRLLKPEGILAITSLPNFASLTIRLGLDDFALNRPMGHLNYFSHRTFSEMLRRIGFGQMVHATSYGVNLESVKRLLRRSSAAGDRQGTELAQSGTPSATERHFKRLFDRMNDRFMLGTMMDFYAQRG